jgi:hypothetical protein
MALSYLVAIDTGRNTPEDIYEHGSEPGVISENYYLHERSVVVLLKKMPDEAK